MGNLISSGVASHLEHLHVVGKEPPCLGTFHRRSYFSNITIPTDHCLGPRRVLCL